MGSHAVMSISREKRDAAVEHGRGLLGLAPAQMHEADRHVRAGEAPRMLGRLAERDALARAGQRLLEIAGVGQRGGQPDARGHRHEAGHAPALPRAGRPPPRPRPREVVLRRAIGAEHVVGLAEPEVGDDQQRAVRQRASRPPRACSAGADGRGLIAERVVRLGEVGRDPPEAPAVAQRLGVGRGPAQVVEGAGELAERREGSAQVERQSTAGGEGRARAAPSASRISRACSKKATASRCAERAAALAPAWRR